MIFQEPMTSLNPAYTIGSQMTEVFRRHRGASQAQAMQRASVLLARVGIAAPELRLGQYPHELSGGLRQRVMIAMALMCDPQLLIADEPTTALDVTVQAQILSLLLSLQKESGLAILLITHDLGIVAHMADRVSIMYAGQIAESASTSALFSRPLHPYSRGLLDCVPVRGRRAGSRPLATIPGVVPRMTAKSRGCGFRERCTFAMADCAGSVPLRQADTDHRFLCHLTPDRQEQCAI
jgi:peptide/nickel transport system ATP-binding protein